MQARTVTAVLDAPRSGFSATWRTSRIPDWRRSSRANSSSRTKAKVVNGLGEFYFSIAADPETGVIDSVRRPD